MAMSAALAAAPAVLGEGVWISPGELATLPMDGEAWQDLLAEASGPAGTPNISNQDDDTDVRTMAKAIVHARTGLESFRLEVIALCMAAMETENGGRTLALGRNLIGYVIAADLVGLPAAEDAQFRAWLDGVRFEELDGRTLVSTHEDRPNNWGTHAGASRLAAAAYLGDWQEFNAAATVFQGWLGDRDAYSGFEYGELSWQANPDEPVGINPLGSTIQGHPVDGVLPDDQRRGGSFEWPPPAENYVYEALQGAIAQAVILQRHGYDAFNWSDRALLRAYQWLHTYPQYPATGDDTWQPHLVNHFYGTRLPAPIPSNHGKNVGYTDFSHGRCSIDVDGDQLIGDAEVEIVFDNWSCQGPCPGDMNGDQRVDNRDYLMVLGNWGECTGEGTGVPPGGAPVAAPPRDPFLTAGRLTPQPIDSAMAKINGLEPAGSRSGGVRRRPRDIAGTVRARPDGPRLAGSSRAAGQVIRSSRSRGAPPTSTPSVPPGRPRPAPPPRNPAPAPRANPGVAEAKPSSGAQ